MLGGDMGGEFCVWEKNHMAGGYYTYYTYYCEPQNNQSIGLTAVVEVQTDTGVSKTSSRR
jgi:hypothetical protein